MENRERICRLCLQKCPQNFKNIQGNAKEAVEILLPKINIAVSDAPVMCTNCAKTLEKYFDFKWTCLCRNRSIVSCVNREDCVKRKLNYLREIKEENDNSNGIQDPTACELCAKPSNSCSIVSLDVDEKKIMLEECLPELDISITKICIPCHESLLSCFHFISKCLIVEEKIQKYARNSSINNDGVRVSIQLEQIFSDEGANSNEEGAHRDEIFVKTVDQIYHDVEQFMSKDVSSCLEEENIAGTIKEEGELLEKIYVKQTCENFVKREDQDFYNEIQFTEGDLFALDEESNILGMIKVEEEFFEEEENKVEYKSENCIEMEEQESKNLQFRLKVPSVKANPNQIARIKPEVTFQEGEEAANGKVEMNCDYFLETENKKFYSLSHFTLNNVLTSEEDYTKFDDSRTEEMCSEKGENDAERENKYLATMDEEQKYNLNEEVDIKPDMQNSDRFEDDIVSSEFEVDPTKPCTNLMSVNKTISEIKNRKRAIVHKDKDPLEVIYKCDSCSFQAKRKISLNDHLLIHKDASKVTMYSCNDCSFQARRKSYLTKHMLKHKDPSEVTMYKCGSCLYQTKRKDCLIKHMVIHEDPSDVTMYSCDFCSFQTKHKGYLTTHMLTHKDPSEVTMHKCGSCLYQTKRRDCLINHMVIHKDPSDVTMYNCDFCSFQTKHKGYLTTHMLTHKDPSDVTMYNCDFCSLQTKYKSCLTNHIMLRHKNPSEVTMYNCDICLFQTKHKSYLKGHLLTHKEPSELTMYNCDICSFQTKRKCYLREHLRRHKGSSKVTMYNCNICSFQTKYRSGRIRHMLIHKDPSDVTMYNCDICSFQTKHKSGLNHHLLTHGDPSEITLYNCNICSFQTKYKSYLKRHLLTHKDPSEVTMYNCDFCSFQTKHKRNLKCHLLTHKVFLKV